ncbi:DUF397 domain-containing protein [Actinosynnema sp. NPDC053489]|uniref:DUF397 domain-containing protein n=1 Tax=Actinosynnema sp. NPDC053489 TaxID=3363916 RepID=UPI0037CC5B8B
MQRQWRRSSRSSAGGPECVEVALDRDGTGVRDSKDRTGGELGFGLAQWRRFTDDAKGGAFDRG